MVNPIKKTGEWKERIILIMSKKIPMEIRE